MVVILPHWVIKKRCYAVVFLQQKFVLYAPPPQKIFFYFYCLPSEILIKKSPSLPGANRTYGLGRTLDGYVRLHQGYYTTLLQLTSLS